METFTYKQTARIKPELYENKETKETTRFRKQAKQWVKAGQQVNFYGRWASHFGRYYYLGTIVEIG